MLKVSHASKHFGGVTALNDVSVTVHEDEILGVIGPNGAGKTTLFNAITGVLPPESGTILMNGEDITGLKPYEASNHGIVRTFQVSRMLYTMTVMQNMMLMPHDQEGEKFWKALTRPSDVDEQESRIRERAIETLKKIDLYKMRNNYARELSGGQQKLLEIGRSLMVNPDVMLMDEPMAGVAPQLAPRVLDEIERVQEENNLSVAMIEHDMEAIQRVSDRIVVLADGEVLTKGTPEEVRNNDQVIDLYLGSKQGIKQ